MNEDIEVEFNRIDQLCSRHIAKALAHQGDTLSPVQIAGVKRSFRMFADDVKAVIDGSDDWVDDRGNR